MSWIIGRDALLAYVERWRGGPDARDAAETRLKEYWPRWSQSQEMSGHVKRSVG